jgi:hypothetical protein
VIAEANLPVAPPGGGPSAGAEINVGVPVVGVAAGLPLVPNDIVNQPPGLPQLAPLEEEYTKIGFLIKAARMLASPNNQYITIPSLARMDDAESQGALCNNVQTRCCLTGNQRCYQGRGLAKDGVPNCL